MSRLRVDILSQHPALSLSYSRVAREIGSGLRRYGLNVRWLGVAPAETSIGVDAHVVYVPSIDTHAHVERALDADRPDILMTIGDPWMFSGVPAICRARAIRWASYFAVDAAPFPDEWRGWLDACDVPVVFSAFAHQTIGRTDVRVVPHGVDLSVFAPRDRDAAKRAVGVEGFVVGTVAANQQRKNLPALLCAFARFAKGKHDRVQLYLHTTIDGPCWDLASIARRLGIDDLVRATVNHDPLRGLSDAELATVYNSFDAFVLSTMAEGFGLPILEAQACGIPTLATDCTACSEILPDPFQRLPLRATLVVHRNLEHAVVDEDAIAGRLEQLYGDASLRERVASRGATFARAFTWERCVEEIARALSA